MTDQELELELNEAGTRLGDPPSSVDDLLGILDETSVSKGRMTKNKVVDSLLVVIRCLLVAFIFFTIHVLLSTEIP
ncbi:hypothetical protein Scep_023733 [Stephania cephalantha]|uniref:Uncharacterized protein n=1 Tax=Stephania cephalantha TaxID=152367 RepID=A0AAP0HT22_9MAGN